VYTFNRHDDGSPPRKASQLSPAGREFHLEFIFPNLWQNYISQDVRVVAAFVPVDEEHTILYLRFYQKFLGLPVLSQIINRLAMPFNVYIAHQDRRVVETQLPKRSALRMEEQLIQADNPIIEYRRRREELIAARVHKQKAGSKEVDR
ncbi:MAG: aromatic ring-hydroxylating oxygenase subunit alpha, partial [Anaerolineales bacterium]